MNLKYIIVVISTFLLYTDALSAVTLLGWCICVSYCWDVLLLLTKLSAMSLCTTKILCQRKAKAIN